MFAKCSQRRVRQAYGAEMAVIGGANSRPNIRRPPSDNAARSIKSYRQEGLPMATQAARVTGAEAMAEAAGARAAGDDSGAHLAKLGAPVGTVMVEHGIENDD